MTAELILARKPSMLDVSAITGDELRIHPDDYLELLCTRGFTWPGNSKRDLWEGTRLIEDAAASKLPRRPL